MTCKDCDKYKVCNRIDNEIELKHKSLEQAITELSIKCHLFKNKENVN